MQRLAVFVTLPLVSTLILGCNEEPNKLEREVCEKGLEIVVATFGDDVPKVTPEQREQQFTGCIEELLKQKAKMTPEEYEEMMKCSLAATDVATFSACDPKASSGPRPR